MIEQSLQELKHYQTLTDMNKDISEAGMVLNDQLILCNDKYECESIRKEIEFMINRRKAISYAIDKLFPN